MYSKLTGFQNQTYWIFPIIVTQKIQISKQKKNYRRLGFLFFVSMLGEGYKGERVNVYGSYTQKIENLIDVRRKQQKPFLMIEQ